MLLSIYANIKIIKNKYSDDILFSFVVSLQKHNKWLSNLAWIPTIRIRWKNILISFIVVF